MESLGRIFKAIREQTELKFGQVVVQTLSFDDRDFFLWMRVGRMSFFSGNVQPGRVSACLVFLPYLSSSEQVKNLSSKPALASLKSTK